MLPDVDTWAKAHVPPFVALAIAVVAISTSAILIRWSDAPSLVKAFYRVLFTVALLAPWALGRRRTEFAALSRRDAVAAVAAGVALALHFATWFESLELTTVAASVTLVQTQPLFVGIGASVLLGERLTRRGFAGILVAIGGAALMSVGGLLSGIGLTGEQLAGNGLAVTGAVMAAGYVLAGRSIRQRVSLVPYVVVVYSACALVLFVLVLASASEPTVEYLGGYPSREWALFLGMAVGPGIFGHTVINWTLEHVESSVVSVSLLGEPVGSALLALSLLGEVPAATTLVGGAIVLAGIYVTTTGQRTARTAAPD